MPHIQYRLITTRDQDGIITAFEIHDGAAQTQRVDSWRARAATDGIVQILASGQPPRSLAKDAPLVLDEHLGAHILLVLKAIGPVRRYETACQVVQGIAGMSRQEAMYWFAHSTRKGGLPALRMLLAP